MDPEPDSDLDVDEYQKNVRFSGAGETGRIMGMYMQHKMIEASGEAACNQPAYNQKLWDDRGNWFQAPTPRKIIDIAISIVATIYCGPVGAMIVNMLDDALFTMMDIANGADMMGSLESFGKSAAISAVSSGIGAGFNAIQSATTISSTLLKGTEIMANNVAASSINATNFRALVNGGNAFDSKAFAKGAFGKEAMVGVVAGMAGHAVSTGMGSMNIKSNSGTSLTGVTGAYNVGAMKALNNTMGGLASAAVTYGLTGRTTLNLLNLSMLGIKNRETKQTASLGLFELTVGKNGVTGEIGKGGIDLNLGNMAKCFTGYNESRRVFQMKHSGEANNTAFETIAMIENTKDAKDSDNYRLARELAGGTKRVALTNGVSTGGTNYRGMVDPNDSSVININRAMIGAGTMEDYAKVAAVMSHEGTHSYGNNLESAAYAYGGDSYLQMVRNVGLRGDANFLGEMVKATLDPNNQMVNEQGMQEFWKAVMDKKTGTYTFQWDEQDNFDLTEMGIPGTVSYQDILADPKKFAALLSGTNLSATNAAVTADQLKAMATVSGNKVALQDPLKVYAAAKGEAKENFAFNNDLLTTFQGSLLALQNMGCVSGVGKSLVNASLQKGSIDGEDFFSPSIKDNVDQLFLKRLNVNGLFDKDNPLGTMRNNIHTGIDRSGVMEYYSSTGGVMSLAFSEAKGITSTIKNDEMKISQETSHNGSGTIDDYMNLWGRTASGLSESNKTYYLSGVEAGAKIGTYAETGLTTGAHLHVEYNNDGQLTDPLKMFDDAGIKYKITPSAKVSSGYPKGIDLTSKEFAEKLFSQDYMALEDKLIPDIMTVLDKNDLWKSEGFYSLPTDTVTSYFKNWWSGANDMQKKNMIEYSREKQTKEYKEYIAWSSMPYEVQKNCPFQY